MSVVEEQWNGACLECADGPCSNVMFCDADTATPILSMLREQQLPVVP